MNITITGASVKCYTQVTLHIYVAGYMYLGVVLDTGTYDSYHCEG